KTQSQKYQENVPDAFAAGAFPFRDAATITGESICLRLLVLACCHAIVQRLIVAARLSQACGELMRGELLFRTRARADQGMTPQAIRSPPPPRGLGWSA